MFIVLNAPVEDATAHHDTIRFPCSALAAGYRCLQTAYAAGRFHHYYDVNVAAEFRCRGDDLLGIYADAIREQVTPCVLTLQDDEYHWLSGLPFFKKDYLTWLRDFRYNPNR
ncbi:hypothetical protein ACNKHO_06020 [Shigella flexneri]